MRAHVTPVIVATSPAARMPGRRLRIEGLIPGLLDVRDARPGRAPRRRDRAAPQALSGGCCPLGGRGCPGRRMRALGARQYGGCRVGGLLAPAVGTTSDAFTRFLPIAALAAPARDALVTRPPSRRHLRRRALPGQPDRTHPCGLDRWPSNRAATRCKAVCTSIGRRHERPIPAPRRPAARRPGYTGVM